MCSVRVRPDGVSETVSKYTEAAHQLITTVSLVVSSHRNYGYMPVVVLNILFCSF